MYKHNIFYGFSFLPTRADVDDDVAEYIERSKKDNALAREVAKNMGLDVYSVGYHRNNHFFVTHQSVLSVGYNTYECHPIGWARNSSPGPLVEGKLERFRVWLIEEHGIDQDNVTSIGWYVSVFFDDEFVA